uniref:Interleukin-12 subunit alpha n=1 Tax=Sphaeramia orbicularis TaxID=375764 RepID=A0A673BMA1_9TELE
MAHFHLYFSCCLALMALTWRTSTGLPVRTASADQCAQCSLLFRHLLVNITELLKNAICYAMTSDKILIESKSDTVLACAPTLNQTSTCMAQKNTAFSETECYRNIMKDLAHYDAVIQSYLNLPNRRSQDEITLLRPTLGIIQSLRQNCSLMPNEQTDSSEQDDVDLWEDNSYEDRKKMCKLMKGFRIRAITINRALGYISSGDHMK